MGLTTGMLMIAILFLLGSMAAWLAFSVYICKKKHAPNPIAEKKAKKGAIGSGIAGSILALLGIGMIVMMIM